MPFESTGTVGITPDAGVAAGEGVGVAVVEVTGASVDASALAQQTPYTCLK